MAESQDATLLRAVVDRMARDGFGRTTTRLIAGACVGEDRARFILRMARCDFAAGLDALGKSPRNARKPTGTGAHFVVGASTVYFLHCKIAGLTKIGVAKDAVSRAADLQTTSPVPVALIATIPGDAFLEADLHYRFRHIWRHGEWFEHTIELADFIASIKERVAA